MIWSFLFLEVRRDCRWTLVVSFMTTTLPITTTTTSVEIISPLWGSYITVAMRGVPFIVVIVSLPIAWLIRGAAVGIHAMEIGFPVSV